MHKGNVVVEGRLFRKDLDFTRRILHATFASRRQEYDKSGIKFRGPAIRL